MCKGAPRVGSVPQVQGEPRGSLAAKAGRLGLHHLTQHDVYSPLTLGVNPPSPASLTQASANGAPGVTLS